jgi:hypothetical protein
MQKQDPVDDLFRRKLADYKVTPSAELRDVFIRDAGKEIASRSAARWWIVGSGAGLLIMVGVGLLFYEYGRIEKPGVQHVKLTENKVAVNIKSEKQEKSIASVKRLNEVNEKPAIQKEIVKKPNVQTRANKVVTLSKSSNTPINNNVRFNNTVRINNNAPVNNKVTPIAVPLAQPQAKTNIPPIVEPSQPQDKENIPITSQKVVADTSFIPRSVQEQNTKPEARIEEKTPVYPEKQSLANRWNVSVGASYTPEWMFNTFNNDKFVNNMGLEGTVHFGPYSLRTGVGLSITDGSNETNVETNHFLGTYKALDSIVFTWDAKHDKLVPVIYTTVTNAYDTSVRNNYSYNKKRYTYLEVPLILGYDFWQNKWLSLGVRAGAVMSILLKTENISSTYESGQDRIVTINDVTPGRIQMNWQETGGIDAAFRLSRRLNIEIEPDIKYYFNSIYESSAVIKKPWSVGVRTAFVVVL